MKIKMPPSIIHSCSRFTYFHCSTSTVPLPLFHILLFCQATACTTNETAGSCRSSLHKFFKIALRSHSQHEPSTSIRHHCKVLRLITIQPSIEKPLQLFQRRIHRDDLVDIPSSPKFLHGPLYMIRVSDGPILQKVLKSRYVQIAQQCSGIL